ncbi:MAG: CDP-glucose 4,6-dehydratase [Nitrospira sp.]|nr:CDP-glucose 4,6-dehydratase [Nitrospira sp.]
MPPMDSFWQGKRVLLTGHTGFKGSWLSLWLSQLGAQITGVALPPATESNLYQLAHVDKTLDSYYCDIRVEKALVPIVRTVLPDIVFHLAAQPLVRASYRAPIDTLGTNIMGTAHLLEALREIYSVRVIVVVTTDKVYKTVGASAVYGEHDPLGGHDPYSASKAACEMVTESYRTSFFESRGVAVATARAGNVLGGGDWSADRLIPDAIRAWRAGLALHVRRPNAVRPWQHVLEPLAGYMSLAEKLWEHPSCAGAYNFGPLAHEAATVREVVELARSAYGRGEVVYGTGDDGPREEDSLRLDVEKARTVLDVVPRWPLAAAVGRTMRWYRGHANAKDARALCDADIAAW